MSDLTPALEPGTITDPIDIQEFAATVTDTTPPCNRCKRCHRKIKAPQEYGRTCARKMKANADTNDEVSNKTGITKFGPPITTMPELIKRLEDDTPQITSMPELIARLKDRTASLGMCWACRKQRRCETLKTPPPKPVVVCTGFHEFHYMRRDNIDRVFNNNR